MSSEPEVERPRQIVGSDVRTGSVIVSRWLSGDSIELLATDYRMDVNTIAICIGAAADTTRTSRLNVQDKIARQKRDRARDGLMPENQDSTLIDLSKFLLVELMGCVLLEHSTDDQWLAAYYAKPVLVHHAPTNHRRTPDGDRVLAALRTELEGLSEDELAVLAESAIEDAHAPKYGVQPNTNRVLGICGKLVALGLAKQTIMSFWGSYQATTIGRAALALHACDAAEAELVQARKRDPYATITCQHQEDGSITAYIRSDKESYASALERHGERRPNDE